MVGFDSMRRKKSPLNEGSTKRMQARADQLLLAATQTAVEMNPVDFTLRSVQN